MANSSVTHFSFSRFKAIVRKEALQIRKDRASMAIALLMPIMMLLIFGYAVNTDVDHLPTGVWDQAKTKESRQLIAQFTNTLYFDSLYNVEGYNSLQTLMDRGTIKVAIVIPRDYSYRLDTGTQASIQVIVDGSDPNAARTAVSNAQLITQNKAISLQGDSLAAQGMSKLPILLQASTRVLYNPNMKSLIFNIPALIGLIMQNVTVILTAFALVREKERGTMEQLIVTPIRPAELIVGKLVPYIGIGIFSFMIVLLTGILWFGVPVKGSFGLLIVLSLLFLVTTLAIGILISTVARTQLQAMQMAFATILPSVLLSGFMFPRETMPLVLQWIGGVVPLTYFLEILRGIFLKGSGLKELWQETLSLTGFTILFCMLAMLRFRKKLD
ncbi:ABC transporter permease [Aneurinibacillus tyrosinisolvens]|uniref:ABC transporter permease n=1 Tax=Aneurinibacillus tyrosinisolvens TaxID=1443435 RepID=UPI00063F6B8E|nr:ABC transporter permease [Aneurinibacillus tyrosinisolvens]